MLIFVEGIDKSGKSTFIQQFCKLTNLPCYRKKVPKTLLEKDRHHFFRGIGHGLVELHNLFRFDAVVDRSFISDWVYSNKQERTNKITIWQEWENRADTLDEILIVYLKISKNLFLERITASPDPFMAPEDYDLFTNLYDEYLAQTQLAHLTIPGDVDFDAQCRQLQAWAATSLNNPIKRKLEMLLT